ncbi:hypothetical protein CRENBAI_010246 [Crenichthys baileyi]|uniref:Uncharacterized protein n=1 Tax=Crenichthys baileyi TaxID=28760 RepID=A0AAV9RML7_9TELE
MGAECHSTASVTSGSFLVNDKPPLNRRLCVRNSSPPSRLCFQSKAERLLYLRPGGFSFPPPSSLGVISGRRNSVGSGSPSTRRKEKKKRRQKKQQQQQRDSGPCGGDSSATVWGCCGRLGGLGQEPSTRRDLAWLLWKEPKPGGERVVASRRVGRETVTDNRREREREQASSLGESEGEPECSEPELPLGSESRRRSERTNPTVRAYTRAFIGLGGGEGLAQSRVLPLCCVYLPSKLTLVSI